MGHLAIVRIDLLNRGELIKMTGTGDVGFGSCRDFRTGMAPKLWFGLQKLRKQDHTAIIEL